MYVDGLPAANLLLADVEEMYEQMTMAYKGYGKTGQRMTVD